MLMSECPSHLINTRCSLNMMSTLRCPVSSLIQMSIPRIIQPINSTYSSRSLTTFFYTLHRHFQVRNDCLSSVFRFQFYYMVFVTSLFGHYCLGSQLSVWISDSLGIDCLSPHLGESVNLTRFQFRIYMTWLHFSSNNFIKYF